jgi:hypothetical protein
LLNNRTSLLLSIGIAIIQVVDIIMHVATDQAEPIRITSNVIILLWLALVTFGRVKLNFRIVAAGAIGLYLLLNVIFLATNGVTNPEQGGALRVTLLILIALTVRLSIMLIRQRQRA